MGIGPNDHQDTGALLLKAHVEVHPISPQVGVLPGLKRPFAPCLILILPHLLELADHGGGQPGRPFAHDRRQGSAEVVGADPLEVQRCQGPFEGWAAAQKPRENVAGKLRVPTLSLRLTFIDTRTSYRYRSHSRQDQPSRGMTVAYHRLMTLAILELLIATQVLLDFRFKSCLEQLPRPFSGIRSICLDCSVAPTASIAVLFFRSSSFGNPLGLIATEGMPFHFLCYAFAACSIKRATSSGLETYTAWLPGTSIVSAPARLAILRSRSGLMLRSFVAISAQLFF